MIKLLLSLGLCVVLVALLPTPSQASDELRLKSAFLYNFARFTQWPRTPEMGTSRLFELCIAGEAAFQSARETLLGQTVAGRPLRLRKVEDAAQTTTCHLLFVSRVATDLPAPDMLARPGLLLVGERDGFATSGGTMNFFLAGNKVRFEVNVQAARAAGLLLDSKLLNLATIANGS